MPKYDIPVWKMCEEAAKELPEIFSPIDVIRKVQDRRPEVKASTIRAHVIGCSPNHPSSKHYSIKHELFYYLGNGRYRLLKQVEEIHKERDITSNQEISEEEDVDAGFTFEFEADLEGYLANKLEDIEIGLKLYVSDEGRTGRQFSTGVGRIDILALDRNRDFVVIEIKVGQATDKACSQILRYLGWVNRHLAREQKVRGIIICRNATDGLKYATSTLENVNIKEYEVFFSFREADLEIEED